MTEMGNFYHPVVNIVSQLVFLHVYFNDKVDKNGKVGYGSTVILNPELVELESDPKTNAHTVSTGTS